MSTAQPLRSDVFDGSARAISARASDGLSSAGSGAGSRLAQPASSAASSTPKSPAFHLPMERMPRWWATARRFGVMSIPSLREDKDLFMNDSLLDRWKRFDDARPSLPAEHWLTFGAAIWFLTRETESTVGRVLSIATGLALVYRA